MNAPRPPYGAAALAGLAAFGLYVLTLAPTTAFWDASEYIATAHILGIPHPPGNPLFVVLARSWSLLLAPLGLPVAVRINLFAAATSAAAVGFLFLVAHRVAAELVGEGWRARLGAAASALLAATSYTVWHQSNVNEKVYTVSVLVVTAVTWLAVRWRDRADEPGSGRLLVGAVFLLALGSTNHLMSVLAAPALALLVLLTRPRVLLDRRVLARAVLAVVVGLSFNFFLPLRAAQDPVINEGDPTCETALGAAVAVYTNGARGCPALAANLTREQYQKPPLDERMAPLDHQLTNWFQYFDWQWARGVDPSEQLGTARLPFTLLFLLLGLCGLWAAWRADPRLGLYLTVLAVTLTGALVWYLNFRYGFSLAPEITELERHEVRERDYFFIGGFALWGALAGLGLTWTWAVLADLTRSRRPWRITAPVFVVAFFPLILNWPWASRAGDWAARDWAYDLLMSVEPYAVLFTNGDNDTFPLWYLQEVEGVRKDVTVVVGQYLNTTWYPKQLQELSRPERQRPYEPTGDAAPAAELYGTSAPAPEGPVVDLSHEAMDSVRGARLGQTVTIPLQGVAIQYGAGTGLTRVHQLALSMIHDAGDERPIYFASTGGLMNELGLGQFGVRHGLVTKLVPRALEDGPSPDLARAAPELGGVWFDLPRSLALYDEVYRFRGIRDRDIWQDRSTLNIPWGFYAMTLQLSDAARRAGVDPEVVRRLQDDALAFQVVSEGGVGAIPGG